MYMYGSVRYTIRRVVPAPCSVAIGEPQREITVEPLELPEPLRDLPADKPQEQPQPEKEPDHVTP